MKILLTVLFLITFSIAETEQEVFDSVNIVQLKLTLYNKYTEEKVNGIIHSYYSSGQLREEIPCIQGKPHGIAKIYYKSGKLKEQATYDNGLYHGVRMFYDEEGKLAVEIPYYKDKVHGTVKKYNKDGTVETMYVDKDAVRDK